MFIGKPLFLTPLIEAGNISQAQKLSYVHPEDLGLQEKVESFSGYFTVGNPKCDSNLFFWFFPAKVSLPNVFNLHRCTVVETANYKFLLMKVLVAGKPRRGQGSGVCAQLHSY
jgi:hypothetical protein